MTYGRIEVRRVDPISGTEGCVLGSLSVKAAGQKAEPVLR